MGIFRSFFGRKPSEQPEVWITQAPRAEPGLPPLDRSGRVEPTTALPLDVHRAGSPDLDIPAIPTAHGEDDGMPLWRDDLSDPLAISDVPAPFNEGADQIAEKTDGYSAEPPLSLAPIAAVIPALEETHEAPGPSVEAAIVSDDPAAEILGAAIAQNTLDMIAPQPEPDIRTLLADFETLGDNPEFGLVREALGAGPDGLFGFSTMYPSALAALLRTRFVGTGTVENLTTRPAWGQYYVVDRRYDFSWKTDIPVGQMEAAAVIAQESIRLKRLARQLVSDLTQNRRLFVYAGPATDTQIAAIRDAMLSYGDNTLLHLTIADEANPPRRVVALGAGLLRGYLSHYGSQDGMWNIAIEDWTAICRSAHAQWRLARGA